MILLNLGAALFGSNNILIRQTEHAGVGVSALTALRFLIASAFFLPKAAKGVRDPDIRRAGIELGLCLFAGYSFQAAGLDITTATRGAFTGTFTVLAVPLLVGFSGRAISPKTWVAAAVSIFGVGLLTNSGGDPNLGDAYCIMSALLFGVHKFRTEALTGRIQETEQLMAVQLCLVAALASAVCLPDVAALAQAGGIEGVLEAAARLPWAPLGFMGLATTAFTLWAELESMKTVSAPLAALIYSAEPLWGALFAWWLGGETFGGWGFVGAGMIMASSVYSQVGGDKSAPPGAVVGAAPVAHITDADKPLH